MRLFPLAVLAATTCFAKAQLEPNSGLQKRKKHDNIISSVGKAAAESYNPPAPPAGAQVVQFSPSKETKANIAVLANNLFKTSGTSHATKGFIGLHGMGRDGSQTFPDLYNVVGEEYALAVPNFYEKRDRGKPTTDGVHANYLNATQDMVWPQSTKSDGTWVDGFEASEGGLGSGYDLNGAKISSYDVIDQLVELYADKSIYPKMEKVIIAGHSAGAKFINAYSFITDKTPSGVSVRYVHANAPSSLFYESHRPLSTSTCSGYQVWPYGLEGDMPSYVKSRKDKASFSRWAARDVVRLIGTEDTAIGGGDQNCAALVQGGNTRLSRNYGAWVYENILAGTKTDLSMFSAYNKLKTTGIESQSVGSFNKRLGIVQGVSHNSGNMFSSPTGRQALTKEHVDQGPLPNQS